MIDIERLPGGDIVAKGLADLRSGVHSDEALLVAIGARRLRTAGLEVPDLAIAWPPEHRLFESLEAGGQPETAHSRYNALLRRLVSFERALEHARSR